MIYKFGVKNYFCFKEGVEISFLQSNQEVSSIIGIKGANGSGKTNILKAVSFLSLFTTYSASSERLNSLIPVISHFNNDDDTEFYIEFENDGNLYIYELSLTKLSVKYERIYRRKLSKGRKTLILERIEDEIVKVTKDLQELNLIKLRSDASIISQYRTYNFSSYMEDMASVSHVLGKVVSNVNLKGYQGLDKNTTLSSLSEEYLNNVEVFKFVKNILKRADSSIKDVSIKDRENDKGEKEYFPVFLHSHDSGDQPIPFLFESSGTQTLFWSLSHYWYALKSGSLLCIDEFDVHLHALILPDILELFENKELNQHGAQFIFTAHNTEIIDKLGKYRTVLVDKEDGESFCYRLDEIPGNLVRNDRSITPLYLKGKIGGVPNTNV